MRYFTFALFCFAITAMNAQVDLPVGFTSSELEQHNLMCLLTAFLLHNSFTENSSASEAYTGGGAIGTQPLV